MVAAIDRFMCKTVQVGCCWEWRGQRNSKTGRAYFKVGQINTIAARWLYVHLHGPLRPTDVVMHKCDNNVCVNPLHLHRGSQLENIVDRDSKGSNRLCATHCVNGHAFDETNTRRYGPGLRWRMCRACGRERTASYRIQLEAEAW